MIRQFWIIAMAQTIVRLAIGDGVEEGEAVKTFVEVSGHNSSNWTM